MNRIRCSSNRRPLPMGAAPILLALMLGAAPTADLRAEEAVPSITSIEPAEGPAGTEVRIRGGRFGPRVGALQGTSGVSFNGVWVTPSGWSEGEIRAVVPPGAGSGEVVVSAGGRGSHGMIFTVTGAGTTEPAIATVSPGLGPEGTLVTIRGAHFQAVQAASTVTFNGVEAEPVFWSGEEIRVPVPEGAAAGPLVVSVGGAVSRSVGFEVSRAGPAVPRLDWLGPVEGREGRTVRIEGVDFGSHQGALQGISGVSFAGVWATPSHWSGTLIEVPVPRGAPSGPVVVVVEGRSSRAVGFTVMRPAPAIHRVTPVHGPEGTLVRIEGAHFGSPLGARQGSSGVRFDEIWAEPLSWSEGEIEVLVPGGVWAGPVVVRVDGRESNPSAFTVTESEWAGGAPGPEEAGGLKPSPDTGRVLAGGAGVAASGPAPLIKKINPSSGPVGTVVMLRGNNFQSSQGASTVTFNGVEATPASWKGKRIQVPVPAGATSGPVVVTVGGQASNGVPFTVIGGGPVISGLSPASGPVGTSVAITGTGFGASQGTSTVAFNGVGAVPTRWSGTRIEAPVPAGATSGPVVVTVDGEASHGAAFTVTGGAPSITKLNPASGPVGTVVTIRGNDFQSSQGAGRVTFNGVEATPASWQGKRIEVAVPAGATTGAVVVTVNGQASNGVAFKVIAPGPSITKLNPAMGPVGTMVTVRGNNFQSSQGASTVTFNGVAATPASWKGKRIQVPVPKGATTGPVVVTVNGQASNEVSFKVIAPGPAIKKVNPSSGPVGTVVMIRGNNFQSSQGASTVTFNGVKATPTSWKGKRIQVSVPAGATSGPVVVTVNGEASNGVEFAVEEEPEIY